MLRQKSCIGHGRRNGMFGNGDQNQWAFIFAKKSFEEQDERW